jgi:hypothetical protein
MEPSMDAFKLTSWNVEWLVDTFDVASGAVEPGSRRRNRRMPTTEQAAAKLTGIQREIGEIDPDILFLSEAIPDPDRMAELVQSYFPDYRLITHEGQSKAAYHIQGEQWMWFLTKPPFKDQRGAHLLDIATWQAYTRKIYMNQEARRQHRDGQWWVSVPRIDKTKRLVGAHALQPHNHYRHPQILVFYWDGMRVEFIGVHLKSKFTGRRVPRRGRDEDDKDYYAREDVVFFMANAVVARAKLTTEATDIRNYIDQRFSQEPLPAIFVLGDLNDGPGKELLEREYLLHDLISSLQGDVFFARQFLNHALFDNPDKLRWSVQFKDELDPKRSPYILLDHIVFTEALSRRGLGPLIVNPHMGKVEHEIHDRIASLMPQRMEVSDHRPVTLVVGHRQAG